jgi:hypothetical protein
VAVGIAVVIVLARSPSAVTPVVSKPPAVAPANNPNPAGLPPLGASLKQTHTTLASLAQRGNDAAARRLFVETQECLKSDRISGQLDELQKSKDWLTSNEDYFKRHGQRGMDSRARLLKEIEQTTDIVSRSEKLCDGVTKDELNDGSIYEWARQAAKSGDDQAAACLVVAPWTGPDLSPDQAEQYRDDALSAADAAIKRGSWRAVSAMSMIYQDDGAFGYRRFLMRRDPASKLKYVELLRLGTPDGSPYAQALDEQISFFSSDLSPEEINAARGWSADMFSKYLFMSGPPMPDALPCDM